MANELAGGSEGRLVLSDYGCGNSVGVSDANRAVRVGVVGMMRRPAHGATRRPPLERPGTGFGRPMRARPDDTLRDAATIARLRRRDPAELLRVASGPEVALDA